MSRLSLTRRSVVAASLASAGWASAATQAKAGAYRSIRYARAERFEPAVLEPFSESLIQAQRGPIAPQLPSRLEISMGPQAPNRQDEHCQVLSVFTPSRSGKRPVLVFYHGGAYITGGGELPWYDGDSMAAENDIVVVSVTHRLGALGFWLPPGSKGLSPAFTDILASLQWIKANIAKFGGDPAAVTISGQSAGAATCIGLTDWGYGQTYFQRIVPQSGGALRMPRAEGEALSRQYDAILGVDPRKATVEQILQGQRNLGVARNGDQGWRPVAPEKLAPINVDAVIGWASEDPAGHMLLAQGKRPTPGTPLEPFRESAKRMASGNTKYGQDVAAAGRTAFLYEFDWKGPDTGLGNCHCIDLAFLYGGRSAWAQAPMLAGVDWNEYERMGRSMRAQWGAFCRRGDPSVVGGPKWSPVTAAAAPVASLV